MRSMSLILGRIADKDTFWKHPDQALDLIWIRRLDVLAIHIVLYSSYHQRVGVKYEGPLIIGIKISAYTKILSAR